MNEKVIGKKCEQKNSKWFNATEKAAVKNSLKIWICTSCQEPINWNADGNKENHAKQKMK